MSVVSSVVIITHELDEKEKFKPLNDYLLEHDKTNKDQLLKPVNKIVPEAGYKCLQRDIYLGAFKNLDEDEFIRIFKSLDIEETVLVIGPEHGGHKIINSDSPDFCDTQIEIKPYVVCPGLCGFEGSVDDGQTKCPDCDTDLFLPEDHPIMREGKKLFP